jgi:hypothetical protein
MMQRLTWYTLAFATLLVGLPGSLAAQTAETAQTLLCIAASHSECSRGEDCERVTPSSVDAPDHLVVDFAAQEIRTLDGGPDGRRTAIERSDRLDNKIILQGAEDGVEGVRDGLGWTIAISEDSGGMVLSAVGDDVAFVIFGRCLPLAQ